MWLEIDYPNCDFFQAPSKKIKTNHTCQKEIWYSNLMPILKRIPWKKQKFYNSGMLNNQPSMLMRVEVPPGLWLWLWAHKNFSANDPAGASTSTHRMNGPPQNCSHPLQQNMKKKTLRNSMETTEPQKPSGSSQYILIHDHGCGKIFEAMVEMWVAQLEILQQLSINSLFEKVKVRQVQDLGSHTLKFDMFDMSIMSLQVTPFCSQYLRRLNKKQRENEHCTYHIVSLLKNWP